MNILKCTVPKTETGQDFIGQDHYDKVECQNQGHTMIMMLTPTPLCQCPYQVSTSYTLRFLRYSPLNPVKIIVPVAHPVGHDG